MNTFLSRRISATMVLVFGLLFATQLYGATNVTISTAATTNMNYAAGAYTPTTGAATANINVTELQTRLAATNVSVSTTSTGPNTGSITVSNAVTWSSSYGLTLNARGNLSANASISNTGTGAIVLLAAQGVDGLLTLSTGCTLTTTGGAVNLTAGTATWKGSLSISGSITSNNGNITIANTSVGADNTNNSGTGVLLTTGTINAGAGNISITGYGQIGGTNCQAIHFGLSGQLITTTGSITVNGTGGSGSSYGSGILFYNGYTVNSTSGIISLTGQGGTGSRNDGIYFFGAGGTTKIYSTSGDINLTAKGGTTGAHAFLTDYPTGNNPTVYIGYDGTTTGTTGNIKFMGDGAAGSYLWRSGGNFKVKGQGNLTMLSNSSAGTLDFTLSGVVQGSAWKKITIGDRYVGGVTLSDNLTNTTSGDSIKVVSKGDITINNPIANNTTGKPIIVLAAQGTAGTGLLFTAVPGTLTTANGEIKLRSGVSADGSLISTALGDIVAKGAVSMGATGAQPIDWRASGNMTIYININTSATAAVPISLLAAQGVDGLLTLNTGNTLTTAAGAVNLTAGTATRKGSLSISGSITSTGGNITIANTSAGANSSQEQGVLISGTITSDIGNIVVNGYGKLSGGVNSRGIQVGNNGRMYTTTGMITVNGTGGVGSDSGTGLLSIGGYDIHTTSGDINITGTGAGSTRGDGIHFYGDGATTKIYSTSGNVNLTGKGSSTTSLAFLTDFKVPVLIVRCISATMEPQPAPPETLP